MNANDSLWDFYKTTEQRAGPLPTSTTPLKTPRSQRGTEELNVTTNIQIVETEQDENRNLCTSTQNLQISCRSCRELKQEVQELRRTVEKQAIYINILKKSLNSTSEMDSSESQHGNGSSVSSSANKNTPVQRVTPSKRGSTESSSGSTRTSSSTSTPVARESNQQVTTPRSTRTSSRIRVSSRNRTPTGTPNMTRNVRPVANRTSSSSESPAVPPSTSIRRSRLPPNISQTEPLGIRPRQLQFGSNTLSSPRQTATTNARRSQSRRRLFVNESASDVHRDLQQYQRARSENAIENFNNSTVKDVHWGQACPPRFHLERNRPEFIERVEARQSIIRAASQKRAEIEHKKRLAARAVATGQKSRESVLRDLCADSTSVKAFYEKDMKEITLKNIRKSQSYQNRMWQRMATVDKQANRIIAHSHSLRTRSTSRHRYQY